MAKASLADRRSRRGVLTAQNVPATVGQTPAASASSTSAATLELRHLLATLNRGNGAGHTTASRPQLQQPAQPREGTAPTTGSTHSTPVAAPIDRSAKDVLLRYARGGTSGTRPHATKKSIPTGGPAGLARMNGLDETTPECLSGQQPSHRDKDTSLMDWFREIMGDTPSGPVRKTPVDAKEAILGYAR
ncbi:hypothetical protein B0H15DRAFT_832372, partial [Mycena belliarum]